MEQNSFSLFLSILTFEFDLILGSFFTFWGPNGIFLGLGKDSNTVLGSTHVVEQLSFSLSISILTFDFDLILGSMPSLAKPSQAAIGGSQISWAEISFIITAQPPTHPEIVVLKQEIVQI